MGSPQQSSFSATDILPQDGHKPFPSRPKSDIIAEQVEGSQPEFGAPPGGSISGDRSASPPSVFDVADGTADHETDRTTVRESEDHGYDLKAPPPNHSHNSLEALADRFFSSDHLDLILRDRNLGVRFTRFLDYYRPQHAATLTHYAESKKAIIAVEYANAIASQMTVSPNDRPFAAATLDAAFEERSRKTAEDLIEEALPAYLTHRLTSLVTESLVKEIIGDNAPVMRNLIPSLAEVYTVTDPSIPDNPIIYASDEFCNTTQYGRDYVIGRNCRFLQGPDTSRASIKRIVEAVQAGQECCETLLNYRRDGSTFMNLLMIAPMYDNKGEVRYFIGAQIDISSLIEDGKGLDSFSQLLAQDRSRRQYGGADQDPMNMLGQLGQMLNEPEATFVSNRMRGSGSQRSSGRSTPQQNQKRPGGRRFLSMDDTNFEKSRSGRALWPDVSLGHSGRLPGVYRNYVLVRPYPSLRITFTSPALRIPGLLQTKFIDRIGGPQQIREGVIDALSNGTSVTAKVSWLTNPVSEDADREYISSSEGKPRWIHCTPLLGSDEKVGVWMIVMVEDEAVTGMLNRQNTTGSNGMRSSSKQRNSGRTTPGNDLYADFLREGKGGRPGTDGSQQTTDTARERREVDDQFRDF